MANISLEVVFEMIFLILSGVDVDFLKQKLYWRTYITKEALSTTKQVELVDKKKFAAITLDSEYEIFIVYIMSLSYIVSFSFITSLSSSTLDVHPFCRP